MESVLVDVFAERPLEGNPLTVFLDAGDLDDERMQALARETNHSETTFVTGLEDGVAATRIFTPQTELPFAGHPTLGTAFVTGADALDLKVGRIPVRREGGLLWMTQNAATFGPVLDTDMAAQVIGVPVQAAEVVSTGTPMALLRVADSDAVGAARLRPEAYAGPDVACCYVFAADEGGVHARSFGAFVGVQEDPATGSAAGPLAAWLDRAGLLGGDAVIRQGVEMKRPSRLHIRMEDGRPVVGGRVVEVARSRWDV